LISLSIAELRAERLAEGDCHLELQLKLQLGRWSLTAASREGKEASETHKREIVFRGGMQISALVASLMHENR
jgi:hypothetical protein